MEKKTLTTMVDNNGFDVINSSTTLLGNIVLHIKLDYFLWSKIYIRQKNSMQCPYSLFNII